MIDHVFLSVSDLDRSVAFYGAALAPLGITDRVDFDGKDGPPGHPDLKGFGCKGRFVLWLRTGVVEAWRRMSGSSRTRRPRSMRLMPPRWRRARPTMARRACGFTTIRAIMPATCSTPTATASSSSTRAGSTPSPDRLRRFGGAARRGGLQG